jgi:hypothetical protein
MSLFKKSMLAVAVAGAMSTASFGVAAAPIFKTESLNPFSTGLNEIEIRNRENSYRSAAECAAVGGCLAFNANLDPAGWQRTDPAIGNNIRVGDLFIGILESRVISNIDTGVTWNADNVAPGLDEFSGYFVQQVKANLGLIGGSDRSRLILGSATVADPFGILSIGGADGNLATLADNEMVRLFVDGTTALRADGNITVQQSIASATNGALWAALGVGLDTPIVAGLPGFDADGYVYSEVNINAGGLGNFVGDFYTAFNILLEGPALDIEITRTVNDPAEVLVGGVQPLDPNTTADNNYNGICPGAVPFPQACNDIAGNGQLSANQNSPTPWIYASEDPLQLYAQDVPEPGSLALAGIALAGLGFASRRRRQIQG